MILLQRTMPKKTTPAFATEAQEAMWWYKNRRALDRDFAAAARQGRLKRLDKQTLAASRVISIRLPLADLELARKQAAKRGVPYQTYIKSLLQPSLRPDSMNGLATTSAALTPAHFTRYTPSSRDS